MLTTALLAALALWMLARLRFPTPPVEPRAIGGLLSSLGTGADFDGLATQVARVRAIVGAYLTTVEVEVPSASSTITRPALRIGGDLAIVQVPQGGRPSMAKGGSFMASSTASGLAVVRLPLDATAPSAPRTTRPPEPPQYVIATALYPDGVALRPVFVAAAASVDAPLWDATAWAVPAETGLTPGSFLFNRDGEFAGMAIMHRGSLAFVAADTVLDEANALIARAGMPAGDYGFQVEPLTPALGRALDATAGVVVTWVDPNGPSRDLLMASDVIERVDGRSITTIEHWQRHLAGLRATTPVALDVSRAGRTQTVTITPRSIAAEEDVASAGNRRTPGLTMRRVRGTGTMVTAVAADSPATRAGFLEGDVIMFAGSTTQPTPAQVLDAATALKEGQSLLVGVRRGDERRLLVLER